MVAKRNKAPAAPADTTTATTEAKPKGWRGKKAAPEPTGAPPEQQPFTTDTPGGTLPTDPPGAGSPFQSAPDPESVVNGKQWPDDAQTGTARNPGAQPSNKPEDQGEAEKFVNTKGLVNIVERIERSSEELVAIKDDIKEIFTEAKSQGFKSGIIREVLKRRSADPEKLKEHDQLLALYEDALK